MKKIQRGNEFNQCSNLSVDVLRRIDAMFTELTEACHTEIIESYKEEYKDETEAFRKRLTANALDNCYYEVRVKFNDGVEATFENCRTLGESDLLLGRRLREVRVISRFRTDVDASIEFLDTVNAPRAQYSICGSNESVLSVADRMERIILSSNNRFLWIRKASFFSYGLLATTAAAFVFVDGGDSSVFDTILRVFFPDVSVSTSWIPLFILISTLLISATKEVLYPGIEIENTSIKQTVFEKNRNALGFVATILISSVASYLMGYLPAP